MATRDNSGFKSALNRLLTPEGFANTVVPILGIVESIASKGQSPGTVATAYRKNILDDVTRQQEQETAKWEREQKQRVYDDTSKKTNLEIEKEKSILERESAIPKAMKLADIYSQNPMVTPEEKESYRSKMEAKAFRTAYPEQAAASSFKKASSGTYEIDPEGKTPEQIQQEIARVNLLNPEMKVSVKRPFNANPLIGLQVQKTQAEIDALNQKNREAQDTKDRAASEKITQLDNILSKIESLKKHPGYKGAVGQKGIAQAFGLAPEPAPGTQEAGFVAEFDGLRSLLTLDNISKMRGMGALSDKESAMLQKASTSLSTKMPEKNFNDELNRIYTVTSEAKGKFGQVQSPSVSRPAVGGNVPIVKQQPVVSPDPKLELAKRAIADPAATDAQKRNAQAYIDSRRGQ